MKSINKRALTLASAALFCANAVGQEPTDDVPSRSISQAELKAGDVRASNLLGAMVKRLSGESIGEVEDLIVSGDANVRLAVISVGGVLGLGAKTVAIPFDQFTVAPDGSILYLTLSEEDLSARPAFDLEGDTAVLPAPAEKPAVPEDKTSQAREPETVPEALSVVQQPTAHDADPHGAPAVSRSKASKQPASALIGAQVIGGEQLPIGKISDLVVTAEPPDVQVIVELSSASSESSARYVAVPLGELTIPRDHGADPHRPLETVETTLTLGQLEALPQFPN